MRRTLTLVLALGFAVVMALPAQAANAHFVPSSWSGTLNTTTGVVRVGYQVAGLGPRMYGTVRIMGWVHVDAQCQKKGPGGVIQHFTQNQDRVAEHSDISDRNGQYRTSMSLNPASICPPGTTLLSAVYDSAHMDMYLWEGVGAGSIADAKDHLVFDCTSSGCGLITP